MWVDYLKKRALFHSLDSVVKIYSLLIAHIDEQKRIGLIQYIGSGNKAFLLHAELLPKFRMLSIPLQQSQ